VPHGAICIHRSRLDISNLTRIPRNFPKVTRPEVAAPRIISGRQTRPVAVNQLTSAANGIALRVQRADSDK
jgi:hypothetical protein